MNICKKIIALHNSVIVKHYSMAAYRNLFGRSPPKRTGSTSVSPMDSFDMETEKEDFRKSLPEIINFHISHSKFNNIRVVSDRMKLVLQENLTGGKFFRGIATVLAYKCIEAPKNITDQSLRVARNVGWCTEMLHAYLIVLDDIMDGSQLRRGKPCWYLRPETGLTFAVNDSIALYGFLTEMLKINVGKLPNYPHFIDAFNETLLCTTMGQYLDIVTGQRKKDYSLFTSEHYDTIVKYKTAYYTYTLPVTLGLLLVDKIDEQTERIIKDISLDLGRLFQIQDDYIDSYGDETQTGKIGTDIQEGKCSWLAVKALERCTNKQVIVFNTCYGSKEPAHIERVKQLYKDLKLSQLYKDEESVIYKNLVEKIQRVRSEGLRNTFLKLLDLTYRRCI